MIETINHLRKYQQEIAEAVLGSVFLRKGLSFSVEIARQGGKNETSAQIEAMLLIHYSDRNRNLIKCSPTFKPQTVVSMSRLKEELNSAGFEGYYKTEGGYIIRLGKCQAIFLSAEKTANVVGNTAHLLLEVDEAQDVDEAKYNKEFKPMGSTTNATNVLYGTTWNDSTLLEKMKQTNLELEKKDGIKRHFRYDWQDIAKFNPEYLAYVEAERTRLGEDHPLFLTQYRLLPIRGGGGFLSLQQLAQLQGTHSRQHQPPLPATQGSKFYVAGLDLAGEAETGQEDYMKSLKPKRDSTVMTIGELIPESDKIFGRVARLQIVEHYYWTGKPHTELYSQFVDLIRNIWHCKCVVVDATAIGEPVASFLEHTLGSRIIPFKFNTQSKTELGFNLLAAINSGCIKMYSADNSAEYREFWFQMERAKGLYRPSQTMDFFVEPGEGHDDYLMSLALLVEAGKRYSPREARGR